jgi:bifunctional UDP-N-acetylglucosamine pyrophosphorylase/glucosamine-1-phosphate N-acetyltransferase
MNPQLNVVMLAAGQGKRMKSALLNVLHPVGGRLMLAHVIATAHALARTRGMSARLIVVVENGADEVRRPFAGRPELTWV